MQNVKCKTCVMNNDLCVEKGYFKFYILDSRFYIHSYPPIRLRKSRGVIFFFFKNTRLK